MLQGPLWRIREFSPSLQLWAWLTPILTAIIAGLLRFYRLGTPHDLVFDETYYVKDAYSYLRFGYEKGWATDANGKFIKGDFSGILDTPGYVVHPPVGKWLIAWGMALFGPENPVGWRFSTAVAGTLAVLILAFVAQKLFRSVLLGGVAGLLYAVDGHAIVQSRTGLLDNFVSFFALLAFAFLLLDRDDGRKRLAFRLSRSLKGLEPAQRPRRGTFGPRRFDSLDYGPFLGMRWWRLAAGISLGLCAGTKWSGFFFLAAFGLLSVFWDISARRRAGVRFWFSGALLKDSPLAFLTVVPVALLVYLASWTGWFLSTGAYNRNWAQTHPSSEWGWIPGPLRSLWDYHLAMYKSGLSITSDHPYKANAWSWFVMGRPTSFYAQYPQGTCGTDKCAQVVTSLGNPLIWWAGSAALLFIVGYWIFRRDWRAGAIACGWAAGYLPWMMYPERTIFFFYVIAYEPFMILALVMMLGVILGKRDDTPWRRATGAWIVGGFVVACVALSAFFFPLWTAELTSYDFWRAHMWLPSWI